MIRATVSGSECNIVNSVATVWHRVGNFWKFAKRFRIFVNQHFWAGCCIAVIASYGDQRNVKSTRVRKYKITFKKHSSQTNRRSLEIFYAYLLNECVHDKQLHDNLLVTSCWCVHTLKFMISGASYMRKIPSAEQVVRNNPIFFGVNLTSVTDVRESTRFARRTHCRPPLSFKIFVSTT